jgi:hypothetical protein
MRTGKDPGKREFLIEPRAFETAAGEPEHLSAGRRDQPSPKSALFKQNF